MNTYRAYVLDAAWELAPVTHVVYLAAAKYGPAWQAARASLNGKEKEPVFFHDAERQHPAELGFGDHLTVAKIVDIRPRNVKLDKAALQAILADEKISAKDKLAALAAQLA